MQYISELPIVASYARKGNYFVPLGKTEEEGGKHYVEGRLIGVAILRGEEGVAVHFLTPKGKGESAYSSRFTVILNLAEAPAILKALHALAYDKRTARSIVGFRVDQGIAPTVYYRRREEYPYGWRDYPKAFVDPAKEASYYADRINDLLYFLEG